MDLTHFAKKLPLGIEEIKQIIPHRPPFLFIDELIEFVDGKSAVGIKHVLASESYFQGHFPTRPLMPGVIILESIAQLGAVFAKICTGGVSAEKLVVFSGAEEVRFRKQIFPGDTLRLETKFLRVKFGHWKMEGKAFVGNERACEAIITATEVE